MRRYGRFVPHSTIMRRMDQSDARFARDAAARLKKIEDAKPKCKACGTPSTTTLCAGCTARIELEG